MAEIDGQSIADLVRWSEPSGCQIVADFVAIESLAQPSRRGSKDDADMKTCRKMMLVIGLCALTSCGSASVKPEPLSLKEWCSERAKPVQSLPRVDPEGESGTDLASQVKALSLAVDRYEQLSEGATGVPASLTRGMARIATEYKRVRSRVERGESLDSVLYDLNTDQESDFFPTAEKVSKDAHKLCR